LPTMMVRSRCGKVKLVVVPFAVENAILMTGSLVRGVDGSCWASVGLAMGDNLVLLGNGCYDEEERDSVWLSPLGLCSSNDVGSCH
jgi:hypothetical protein